MGWPGVAHPMGRPWLSVTGCRVTAPPGQGAQAQGHPRQGAQGAGPLLAGRASDPAGPAGPPGPRHPPRGQGQGWPIGGLPQAGPGGPWPNGPGALRGPGCGLSLLRGEKVRGSGCRGKTEQPLLATDPLIKAQPGLSLCQGQGLGAGCLPSCLAALKGLHPVKVQGGQILLAAAEEAELRRGNSEAGHGVKVEHLPMMGPAEPVAIGYCATFWIGLVAPFYIGAGRVPGRPPPGGRPQPGAPRHRGRPWHPCSCQPVAVSIKNKTARFALVTNSTVLDLYTNSSYVLFSTFVLHSTCVRGRVFLRVWGRP